MSASYQFFYTLCFVPAADESISQRLQSRRRSQADPLRRVLLTTQMKVRTKLYIVHHVSTGSLVREAVLNYFACPSEPPIHMCPPQNQFAALNVPKKHTSQIEGPSIANSYGFRVSMQNLQDAKALHEVSHSSG